jgi:ornithine cyclodeaminase/alanine dehydrogenase-like protein (mu-crystallin family)
MADLPPLLHLTADEVRAAMPPIDERLALAERTMLALATGAGELPSKIGVHPAPAGSFAHAMPALLRGGETRESASARADLLGMKWVAGFPDNRALGLPAIHALVVLSDPRTGVPVAVLDGGPITAERTAAVSGVAIARLARPGDRTVAIVGAGVQARSHLALIGRVLPGATVRIVDRHPERAAAVATEAASTDGVGAAEPSVDLESAIRGADVVVTAASFTAPERRQSLPDEWIRPGALVVAVDYATLVRAGTARDAAAFLVDDRPQFLANRDAGQFDDYPDPTGTLGEAIRDGLGRPASGRVVVTHLGVGLADVIFGGAIVERARSIGLGRTLPR